MLHKLSFALLFAVLTCGKIVSAKITLPGKCPKVNLPKEFDWENFLGVWYEHSRFSDIMEGADMCVLNTYRPLHNTKKIIGIVIWGVDSNKTETEHRANATILGPGCLSLNFYFYGNVQGSTRIERVLGTDYLTWATVYSCSETKYGHEPRAWVLTRDRYPNKAIVDNGINALTQHKISPEYLIETRQNGCHN